MKKLSLLALIEISFFAAFALILDLLPSIKPIPNISISFAMVPIFLLAFRWGFRASFIAGLLWGILQIATGDAWIIHPVQGFIEYFIAFAFIGFAGLFYNKIQKEFRAGKKRTAFIWVVVAVFVGSVARYFWHFLAGVIFIKYFAPDVKNPVFFSFAANGTTMLGAWIFCSLVLILVLSVVPQLIMRKDNRDVLEKKAS